MYMQPDASACKAFQTFHCVGAFHARQFPAFSLIRITVLFFLELERGLTEAQIRIVCKQMFEVMSMLMLMYFFETCMYEL